tara:strand:+ start:3880 stop:6003 length:2124 start_codon:yes stop_codon:yes gene_type:complete
MSKEKETKTADVTEAMAPEVETASTAKETTEAAAEETTTEVTEETTVAEEAPEETTVAEEVVAEEAPAEVVAEETTEAAAEETTTEVTEETIVAEEAPAEEVVAEKATEETAVEEALAEAVAEETIEEFNWEDYAEGGLATYTSKEYKDFESMYDATLPDENQAGVIDGTIINLTDREAIIDIGGKSEGVISLNEFRYNPELKVGDSVEVLIDQQEDRTGQLVLSHRKARSIRSWDRVNSAHDNEEIVNGFVKCRTKGGMIVDVFGIEAFLPGSQIDVKPIRDYDVYVGKTMEFKVVKINHDFKNVVVSHKALIEADIELQKKEIIGKLEKGQVLEGAVKNITSYGVFIDLGGVDGLIHITDLSWSRINHPNEIVELDQKINVVILDFDEAKTRIQLGLKQLSTHPWDALDKELKISDRVKGKVVVLADYGAFIEILPGVEGLIHVSEMSWSTHLRSAQDFLKVGAEVEAEILTLDREERKMSLGLKQLTKDPWADITAKYPAKSKHTGVVRNFTNFGVFVELEEGVDGLVHISDLSWTKKVKHPSEFTSIGAELEIVVLELDTQNRRLSLGHKQVEDNPWDTYETIFAEGSEHEGEVTHVHDKGASVLFKAEGVEGFVPGRHSEKEDGSKLTKGETVQFRVIEFNKGSRKIVLSHTILFKESLAAEKAAEKKSTAKGMKAVQSKVEKSTLGDIDALAELKDKLDKS